MLEVLKKSILFYKLATMQDTPEERKAMYERDLVSLPTSTHANYICEFIGWFYDEPFFEFEKVAGILFNRLMGTIVGIDNILDYLRQSLPTALGNDGAAVGRFMSYAANEYFDLIKGNWGIDTYLDAIEGNSAFLSPEVIRKYQSAIIKKVIDYASGDDLSVRNSKQLLSQLIRGSSLFSQGFLVQLARHLGPDDYADVMAKAVGADIEDEIKELKQKDKFSVFDVAEIIKYYTNDFITKDIIEDLINKSDAKGKEYLRSILYLSVDQSANVDEPFFMLDEEMRPVNGEYQNISLPNNIFVARWSSMKQIVRDKWLKIFADFKVVPRII